MIRRAAASCNVFQGVGRDGLVLPRAGPGNEGRDQLAGRDLERLRYPEHRSQRQPLELVRGHCLELANRGDVQPTRRGNVLPSQSSSLPDRAQRTDCSSHSLPNSSASSSPSDSRAARVGRAAVDLEHQRAASAPNCAPNGSPGAGLKLRKRRNSADSSAHAAVPSGTPHALAICSRSCRSAARMRSRTSNPRRTSGGSVSGRAPPAGSPEGSVVTRSSLGRDPWAFKVEAQPT